MITRLLVANRGEIARRVFRTCRDLGIGTVAVHSDADAGLPFVREADLAVRLPGSTPSATYLRSDLVIDAARRTGADAVHPGYGFASEDAAFARAVLAAGLVWVGPSPEAMEQMASKVNAKRLMAEAGVPVLPELDPSQVTGADLPLLVKASAGGGGRGMRVVERLDAVVDAVARASAEAGSAFGDATVFCEPYLAGGRHVEVQVLGDRCGHVAVLGDRDCSVQRRHQKVVEEAPAPGLLDSTRRTLHDAARAAAGAIGYVGAGTVELMLRERPGPDGAEPEQELFFLEMNTRLQVEHPVTEVLVGLDLVEQQVRVAEGACVAHLDGVPAAGHAVEARLYAEDPASGYQPQTGTVRRFEVAGAEHAFGALPLGGIRLDAGFRSGDTVSTHYDAMLAKVVVRAATRDDAVRRLAAALQGARLHGVRTNRDLLVEVLRHPDFVAGAVGTDFLDREDLAALSPSVPGEVTGQALAAFAAAVGEAAAAARERAVQARVPTGWRSVRSAPHTARFAVQHGPSPTEVRVGWSRAPSAPRAPDGSGAAGAYLLHDPDGEVHGATAREPEPPATDGGPWVVLVDHDGVQHRHEVHLDGEGAVDVEAPFGHLALARVPRLPDPAARTATGSLLAPMPGTVVSVAVAQGDVVGAGGLVLVLEAMKMQHTVTAPADGVVTGLAVAPGDQVAAGQVLAVVEPADPDPDPDHAPATPPAEPAPHPVPHPGGNP